MRRVLADSVQQLALRRVDHRVPGHGDGGYRLVPVRDGADERRRVFVPPRQMFRLV